MIRSILNKASGRDQRGGIAILTALGFLLFSIPLISGALGLAQTTNIDARVKTTITRERCAGVDQQQEGTLHSTLPASRSTASKVPQGGAVQGTPMRDVRKPVSTQ